MNHFIVTRILFLPYLSSVSKKQNIICRERVKQRLALYHGVLPIHMPFSEDAEETFSRAIDHLLVGFKF